VTPLLGLVKGAILSLVDRKSKFTILAKLKSKHAEGVAQTTITSFKRLPRKVIHTLTFDNGKEFSRQYPVIQVSAVTLQRPTTLGSVA